MRRWYQIILLAMNYHYGAFCFFDTLNIIEMLVQKECQKAASDLGGSLLYGGVGTDKYQRPRLILSRQQARRPTPHRPAKHNHIIAVKSKAAFGYGACSIFEHHPSTMLNLFWRRRIFLL